MRENLGELLQTLRQKCDDQILIDRIVRGIRQEKAASYIEALEERTSQTEEDAVEYLVYEMASMLDDGLESGEISDANFVKDNQDTLRNIAKGLFIQFAQLK